jgi:hypothetical protein
MHSRRTVLLASAGISLAPWLRFVAAVDHVPPGTNPTAKLKLAWTDTIAWANAVDVTRCAGETVDDKLTDAMARVAAKGGGVVYFPPGTYTFAQSIKLKNGIVLRGADPTGTAKDDRYDPPTKFEFPRYEFKPDGDGAKLDTAFKGNYCEHPATDSNVGLVHIAVNRGHVHLDDDHSEKHRAGRNRVVFGCVFRNAAVADPSVPNLSIGQKSWQRFTARHHAAVDVKAEENILIANNRLPKSGDDNATMNGYVLLDQKKKAAAIDGVVFDYDNRPAIYVNHYAIGGQGGQGPDGTPETHPHGFRKGIVIRDNGIYCTGRMGIGFCGDGVACVGNVIRFPDDVWRPTATGQAVTTGSSTNDNRAVEMRGWRWVVSGNEYTVHRNWAFDRKYRINDGEGLMHEDHVNSTIRDSVLTGNTGNTYLSLYKTAGIDGLVVARNDIRLGDGRQTIASGAAIFVSADRTRERFPCRNVTIADNTVRGGGILISGDPAEKNVVRGNTCVGPKATIRNDATATVENNEGFE